MSLEEAVRKHLVNPKGTGENIRAQCPFCDSKRSFLFGRENGLYVCFSCGEKGHPAKLLYYFGMSRKRVDAILKSCSISFVSNNRERGLRRQKKAVYKTLPEYVLGAYDTCPQSMLDAGFDMKTLADNDVGYDRIKGRVTFPIRDYRGRIVGVSGRANNSWESPRYLHYEKDFDDILAGYLPRNTDHLYGFHNIYPARYFREDGFIEDAPIYLVEGYKGTLWLQQNGMDACGLQGSHMTNAQCRILSRIRSEIRIMLDYEYGKQVPNQKGECQAEKIAKRLTNNQVTIVEYQGTDIGTAPDDLDEKQLQNIATRSVAQTKINREWRRRSWV